MTSISSVLNASTVVLGYFEGAEICFTIGDCQRVMDCIKVHNIKNIDEEEHQKEVPTTLCVADARLTLTSHTKSQIFSYFNAPVAPAPKARMAKKPKKEEIRKVHVARR